MQLKKPLKNRGYEVVLKEASDINGLNLISNFFPGTTLEFIGIEITDIDNLISELPLNNLYINSRNSFFQKDKEKIKLSNKNKNDEKIQIKFDNPYKAITKIKINLNLSKLNLTNRPNC